MYGQFFLLFAIMFTGYLMRKLNVIDEAMNNGVNKFVVYFAYPCLIIERVGSLDMNQALLHELFLEFALSIGIFCIYGIYTYWYGRLRKFPKENSNVAELCMAVPNDAFMGFPVALIFFGETGLLLMIAHNAAMNVYLFLYGVAIMRRNDESKQKKTLVDVSKFLLKFCVNPNILGLVAGLLLCIVEIPIPDIIRQYLVTVGSIATPMAMIFIGSTLAGCKFLDIILDKVVIESTLSKLFILPLITFGIIYFLPVSDIIKAICVLGGCFPVGAMAVMVAEQEGQDKELASRILFLTTALSIVTIPIAANLIS